MSELYELYKMSNNEIFTKKVCEIAPYFSTIDPLFVQLEPGYAEVTMPNTKSVHNHLGTVHAIAMCNLAEIAAGILTDVSIKTNHRWIPIGMNVSYLAKATSELRGIADARNLNWDEVGEKDITVNITDTAGLEVCRAIVKVKIGLIK